MNFEVREFCPEDVTALIATFAKVYGPDYPVSVVYDPNHWISKNQTEDLFTYVAENADGRLAGLVSFYRVAPFPGLYEFGQLAIDPEFRRAGLGQRLCAEALERFSVQPVAAGVFGEMGCHWTASQSIVHHLEFVDTALEVGLFPAQTYSKEHQLSGRISALMAYRDLRDRAHPLHVPDRWRPLLQFCYQGLEVRRDWVECSSELHGSSRQRSEYLEGPALARLDFWECGADFESVLSQLERDYLELGAQVLQLALNLEDPRSLAAGEAAAARGYSCCGLLPRWFDGDGLLLQRNREKPSFGNDRIDGSKGKELAQRIELQWQ